MTVMPGPRSDGTTPTTAERGKARSVFNRLLKRYPKSRTALGYENAWQLLVVTVLSAQTTDESVNKVAPVLFQHYSSTAELADARGVAASARAMVMDQDPCMSSSRVAVWRGAVRSRRPRAFPSVSPENRDGLVF